MLTSLQQHNVDEQDIVVATPKNKLKILFYHAGAMAHSWVYPAALQLKTYIDILYEDTAPQVQWLIPVQQEINTKDLVKQIIQNDVDVLCTSHYLWNHELLTQQIAEIKALVPKITVIAGGPSIDVNNNKNFFEQYPYIDYAVYGAGEQAFADIINHLVFGKPMIAFNSSMGLLWILDSHSGCSSIRFCIVLLQYPNISAYSSDPLCIPNHNHPVLFTVTRYPFSSHSHHLDLLFVWLIFLDLFLSIHHLLCPI